MTEFIELLTTKKSTKCYNVIVFDGNPSHNWVDIFNKATLKDGSQLRIIQTSWLDTNLVLYPDGDMLTCAPLFESEGKIQKPKTLTIKPDFLIIRNQPRGPLPGQDRKNVLFGLMMADVPAMNSLQSVYHNMERPLMYGALKDIQKRLGKDKFPLIPITYYSYHSSMVISPEKFPSVIKIAHCHASYGKTKVKNYEDFRDISSIVAIHGDYCTGEEFVDAKYNIRVQKVGKTYRVFKREIVGSGWKSNQVGQSDSIDTEMTSEYKLWMDECSKCFGGLDWCAVDALVTKDGKSYIIELNTSAIGMNDHWDEDSKEVANLAIEKMNRLFVSKSEKHEIWQ